MLGPIQSRERERKGKGKGKVHPPLEGKANLDRQKVTQHFSRLTLRDQPRLILHRLILHRLILQRLILQLRLILALI